MTKDKIHLDANTVVGVLDDHKTHLLSLIEDPNFRAFFEMMGGEPEFLDEKKKEVKKWEVK